MLQNEIIKSYIWIFSPIILGLGSSAIFVSKTNIPKCKWNPPGWVFGIVWPILYLLLGYASYLVWKTGIKNKDILYYYIVHLVLLLVWWPYFVWFPNPFFATTSLFLLTIYAIYLGWEFYKINKTAGYLFTPYILWLCFATLLTLNC